MIEDSKETVAEILVEHNKSLNLLKETLTALNDSNTDLRARLADVEARLAYFTNANANDGTLIIPDGRLQ